MNCLIAFGSPTILISSSASHLRTVPSWTISGQRGCQRACFEPGHCQGTFSAFTFAKSDRECLLRCQDNEDCEFFNFNSADNSWTELKLGIALRETGFPVFPFSRRFLRSRSRTRNLIISRTGTRNGNFMNNEKCHCFISQNLKNLLPSSPTIYDDHMSK